MKDEIKKILQKYMLTNLPLNDAAQQVLDLFAVSISLPSDEEIREPIENALYSTDRLTTDQCTELADGILTYLNESGLKVVRQ